MEKLELHKSPVLGVSDGNYSLIRFVYKRNENRLPSEEEVIEASEFLEDQESLLKSFGKIAAHIRDKKHS